MKPIERRVTALEASGPERLSPAAKAWLGQTLTAAEKMALHDSPKSAVKAVDTSDLSQESRAWLGLD